ncbi:MAG: hypothetical protein Q8L77_13585 [Nitrospirota bacterium]|nr:hypothetical protein [Nitrospirota bacterium]
MRNKLKHLLANAQSFEHLADRLADCHEQDLLAKLNFLMACAMTPPIFPLIPHDEPRVNDAFIEQHDVYDAFLEKNFATSEERSNASFITLNYDCLLERAICRTFFKGPQDGESQCLCRHVKYCIGEKGLQSIEVLKPHGSINWVGNLVGSDNEDGTIPITVNFEPNGRPIYTQVDIVPSPIGRDPDGLIIATYAPGKKPQANSELLFTIQENAKSCAREAVFVEIIGIHLPPENSNDDPFLCELLELMADKVKAGCRVIYVNPDENEIKRAQDYYHFETAKKTFRDYVESASCVMR